MEYISIKEASNKWELSERRLTYLCRNNRIEGTIKENDFGFKPSTSLREGLRSFAKWYKEFYL